MARLPIVLSIAGSDPGGGAGIQADLKTFAALDAYGCAVIACLTAQSTRGVVAVDAVAPTLLRLQLDVLLEDIRPAAVKIGALGSPENVAVVADVLATLADVPVVVDPVMKATSGSSLADRGTVALLRECLLPIATVITPNAFEAGALAGGATPVDAAGMEHAARVIAADTPAVLVTGGDLAGDRSVDVLCVGDVVTRLDSERVDTPHTHGAGCTLSSAIAVALAEGLALEASCRRAKAYVAGALDAGRTLGVGGGRGPLDHGWTRHAR